MWRWLHTGFGHVHTFCISWLPESTPQLVFSNAKRKTFQGTSLISLSVYPCSQTAAKLLTGHAFLPTHWTMEKHNRESVPGPTL